MTPPGWMVALSDPVSRVALGRRITTLTEEVFQVLRWSIMVGFARFMASSFSSLLYDVFYWVFAALLFAYLASRFLLSPEVRIFGPDAGRTQRVVQTGFNLLICVLAFVLVLWAVNALVEGITTLRSQEGLRVR